MKQATTHEGQLEYLKKIEGQVRALRDKSEKEKKEKINEVMRLIS